MDKDQILSEITALKNLLEQSDHVPNKLAEGIVLALDGATAINAVARLLSAVMSALEEYREVIKNRAAWRARINELEEMLNTLEDIER